MWRGDGVSDGLQGRNGSSKGGLMTDRMSAIGLRPLGAEAVGDFSIGDAGPQRTFGFVVGWRNGAIGHEDEKTWTKLFDRAFPFDAGWVNGAHGEDAIKLALKASFVDLESDVVPGVAPLCRLAGQTDEVAQRRGEDAVALVDHVLRVAQEMGEADLLVLFAQPAWAP